MEQHIVVAVLHQLQHMIHARAGNERVFPRFKIHRQVIAVQHFGDAGQKLVARHSRSLLVFPLLLTLMCIGDISAQNVGDRFSGFIRTDEHIDLVPFLAVVRDCAVLQTADEAVGIGSCPKRVQTGKRSKLLNVRRVKVRYLLVIGRLIVVGGLKNIHELRHAVADDHAVLAGSEIQRQVVAVKHFCQLGQNLIFRGCRAELFFAFLLRVVSLCDVTAEDVGNSASVLLGVDKYVDFVPLVFGVSGVENRVLKRASVSVLRRIVLCRFKVGKLDEAGKVSRMNGAFVKIAQLSDVGMIPVFINGSAHTGADDQGIAIRLQIHGQVVAVHDLRDLRQDHVLSAGRSLQLVFRLPDGVAFFHKEMQRLLQKLVCALHFLLGLSVYAGKNVSDSLFLKPEPRRLLQNILVLLCVGQRLPREHLAQNLSVRQRNGNRKILKAEGTFIPLTAIGAPCVLAAGNALLAGLYHFAEFRHSEILGHRDSFRVYKHRCHAAALRPVVKQPVKLVHIAEILQS